MSFIDQHSHACRCEWGLHGIDALAPADVTIVVDVLSFTTCVDVALSRGVVIFPYRYKDDSASAFAAEHSAELAGPRGTGKFSLSPASLLNAEAGTRCVLPSPNGATLILHAADRSAHVLAGCLRNRTAIATQAEKQGATFNVIPAGERWLDGSLRPALEDLVGAGGILSLLPGTKSPEAEIAIAAFERSLQSGMIETFANCSSGWELLTRGFGNDVELAADLDVSRHIPRFNGVEFTNCSK